MTAQDIIENVRKALGLMSLMDKSGHAKELSSVLQDYLQKNPAKTLQQIKDEIATARGTTWQELIEPFNHPASPSINDIIDEVAEAYSAR